MLETPVPDLFNDAQRATVYAGQGLVALSVAIEAAGEQRRVWKQVTPDAGASAAIYMTHGLAALLGRSAAQPGHHLNEQPQRAVREVMQEVFAWSESEESRIAGLATTEHPDIQLAFDAIAIILGDAAAELPGFQAFSADFEVSFENSISWDVTVAHMNRSYLAVTDPEGLAQFDAKA